MLLSGEVGRGDEVVVDTLILPGKAGPGTRLPELIIEPGARTVGVGDLGNQRQPQTRYERLEDARLIALDI